MRKLIASTFVSLDGVMQAPGGPEEDRQRRFRLRRLDVQLLERRHGPLHERLRRQGPRTRARPQDLRDLRGVLAVQPADSPIAQTLNAARKHVASRTLKKLRWNNSTLLGGDVVAAVSALKSGGGTRPADHRQRQPDPDAAGRLADRRVQRVDLPRRARARQAAVRSRREARRAPARRFASLDHRRRDEHLRACRRCPARLVCAGRAERQRSRKRAKLAREAG